MATHGVLAPRHAMERSGHSGLGIASFGVSLFGLFLLLIWFVLAALDAPDTVVGLAVLLQVTVSFVGAAIGVAPLFSQVKVRTFAILGVMFGMGGFVIGVALIGLGLWALSSGLVSP